MRGQRANPQPAVFRQSLSSPGAVVVEEAVSAFADAVSRLLADPGRRARLGAAGVHDVATRWSGPKMAKKLRDLYCELVPNP
jgi:glycosyltransferase involved in cell wall biosynthesis